MKPSKGGLKYFERQFSNLLNLRYLSFCNLLRISKGGSQTVQFQDHFRWFKIKSILKFFKFEIFFNFCKLLRISKDGSQTAQYRHHFKWLKIIRTVKKESQNFTYNFKKVFPLVSRPHSTVIENFKHWFSNFLL